MIWTAIMFKERERIFQDGRRHNWVMSPLLELFLRRHLSKNGCAKGNYLGFSTGKNFDCSSCRGSPEGLLAIYQVQYSEKAGSFAILKASVVSDASSMRRSLYLITNVLGSRRPCRRWLHENYAVFNRPWPSRVYLPIRLSDLPPLFHATQNIPSFLIQKGWWIKTRLRFRTPLYIYMYIDFMQTPAEEFKKWSCFT